MAASMPPDVDRTLRRVPALAFLVAFHDDQAPLEVLGQSQGFEEIILLSIWKLGDNAYGIAIIENVERDTGIKWMSGSIYGALNRLKKNRYISTERIEQSPEQTGRPRIYYRLTKSGMDRLIAVQKVTGSIWDGVPDLQSVRQAGDT